MQPLMKPQKKKLRGDRSGDLVAKVLVPQALSNFWTADYWETLSWPRENVVVPHPVGRVNSQESPP
jgi:hypothetical protein